MYENGTLIFEVAVCRHLKPCLWHVRIRAQYRFQILQSRKDICEQLLLARKLLVYYALCDWSDFGTRSLKNFVMMSSPICIFASEYM